MIAHVAGEVTEKFHQVIVVDVGGVGYEVQLSTGDADKVSLGSQVTFYTYHHVREQAEELFGFSSLAAKKLFELLITVQGVGPKAALAVLSLGEAEQVRSAIASADVAFVQQAAGVGKKTAERVVVDLRDKVGLPTQYTRLGTPAHAVPETMATDDDAREALIALGYTLADATKALESIDPTLPIAERVTLALKQ